MFELAYIAAMFGGFCLILGVVYPLCALLVYPIYRKLGGSMGLKEYMSCI